MRALPRVRTTKPARGGRGKREAIPPLEPGRSDESTSASSHDEAGQRRQRQEGGPAAAAVGDTPGPEGFVAVSPEAQMMLHDIREWIRSQPDGCVSINYVVEESKRGGFAGISLHKSSLRQVLRETFGAAVVERSVSNTKLLKP